MSTIYKPTREAFYDTLSPIYAELFKSDPAFAQVASKTTPEELARRMTIALAAGAGSKDGEGVKRACKALGIAHTYKAIKTWFDLGTVVIAVTEGGAK